MISQIIQLYILIVLDSKLMGICIWGFYFSGAAKLDASASDLLHREFIVCKLDQ